MVQLAEVVDISARRNMSERYKTLGKWLVWVSGKHSFVSIFHRHVALGFVTFDSRHVKNADLCMLWSV